MARTMTRRRRRAAYLLTAFAGLATLLQSSTVNAQSSTIACSESSKCPSSAPCCNSGQCGSGALHCAGGCHPLMSNTPTSCQPNPICKSENISFSPSDYNNSALFNPILNYNGYPSTPFTLDFGSLGQGDSGVLLELSKPTQTRVSTTNYMLYGNVEATIRHDARAGLVAAFIFMSDVQDEIDWEFTTSSPQDAQTNIFSLGKDANAQSVNQTGSWSVSDFHTFGVNWQPDQIQWSIDGQTVRTLTREQANDNYPQSPARIQLSIWAGGNATNPGGVIQWAGGPIDWNSQTYQQQGYYGHEITSFAMNCASPSLANITTVGSGQTPTSWVYTGNNFSGTAHPEFQLSTSPITNISDPGAGGLPGMPGYAASENAKVTNGNSWDGSGNTLPGRGGSGGGWNGSIALKYGVPIAAGLIGLALLWGLCVWGWRKHRNSKLRPEGTGITFNSLPGSAAAVAAASSLNGKRGSKSYAPLRNVDDAPMGAQKLGQGYGPAPGPRPGAMSNTTAPTLRYDDAPQRQSVDSYALSSVASTPYQQHSSRQQQQEQNPFDQRAAQQSPAVRSYQSPYQAYNSPAQSYATPQTQPYTSPPQSQYHSPPTQSYTPQQPQQQQAAYQTFAAPGSVHSHYSASMASPSHTRSPPPVPQQQQYHAYGSQHAAYPSSATSAGGYAASSYSQHTQHSSQAPTYYSHTAPTYAPRPAYATSPQQQQQQQQSIYRDPYYRQ